jgi:hypothetical protein
MARLKLYYTTDEITTDLYTTGNEYMTPDNVEYIGAYHRYITGEIYTGTTWNSKLSKKLIRYVENRTTADEIYKTLQPSLQVTYALPSAIVPQPSSSEIAEGSMQRYFIKRINDANILEIDSNQYSKWLTNVIDKKMYDSVKLTWMIGGSILDEHRHGIVVPGVITHNSKQRSFASRIIPGLKVRLENLLELYTDNDYAIPADINRLDS